MLYAAVKPRYSSAHLEGLFFPSCSSLPATLLSHSSNCQQPSQTVKSRSEPYQPRFPAQLSRIPSAEMSTPVTARGIHGCPHPTGLGAQEACLGKASQRGDCVLLLCFFTVLSCDALQETNAHQICHFVWLHPAWSRGPDTQGTPKLRSLSWILIKSSLR